jgi:hypothetical protein
MEAFTCEATSQKICPRLSDMAILQCTLRLMYGLCLHKPMKLDSDYSASAMS